ncbi:hypothetical protein Y590_19475 [Methylobacterium sp. AMS5]|nr:hypothetical protein Y590_19475 [Methylobacterium sp. AMS5]
MRERGRAVRGRTIRRIGDRASSKDDHRAEGRTTVGFTPGGAVL